MNLKEIKLEGMDWITMAVKRDKWQAFMFMMISIGVA
jgi:hypothetical protein